MDAHPLDSLTPKERECLRLVAPDRKSAVIADMLGIAVPTVETHLRSARAKLGGVGRFAAARMLIEHEGRQPLTSHPMTIAEPSAPPVTAGRGLPISVGPQPLVMSDARLVFNRGPDVVPAGRPGGTRYDLNALNRIALIAFCLLAVVIAGIAAIPLSDAVQDVARMVMTQRRN